MKGLHWDDLVIERRTQPAPVDDARFREWMNGRRVFVSSRMDTEMSTARESVRSWLKRWGAQPVMWEELTPRDQHPEGAYLEGVDQSSVYLLLIGSSYGAADESGYSPTHKEGRRAEELSLPRLVFEDAAVQPSSRDGRLNDWLRSMYAQVSTGRYGSAEELIALLTDRLREMAAAQETPWIKLGNLIVPGTVSRRRRGHEAEFLVRSRVRDGAVRRALGELGGWSPRIRADRLTWGVETQPISVQEVHSETTVTSEDTVEIRCTLPRDFHGGHSHVTGITINGMGPPEQAEIWLRRAVLGEPAPVRDRTRQLLDGMLEPEGPLLPDVLRQHGAQGWTAEGLTHLYIVEGLLTRFGGQIGRLEIGPASASAVRVSVEFTPGSHGARNVSIEGHVPLR